MTAGDGTVVGCVWGAHRRLVDLLLDDAPTYAWCEEQYRTTEVRRAMPPDGSKDVPDRLYALLRDAWCEATMDEADAKRIARGLRPKGTPKFPPCSACHLPIPGEVIARRLLDGGVLCYTCGVCTWSDCHQQNETPGGTCRACDGRFVDVLERELRDSRDAYVTAGRSCGPCSWPEAEREVRALLAVRDERGLVPHLARRLEGLCAWDRAAAEAIGAMPGAPVPKPQLSLF